MNSRERVFAHLAGQPVDRLPLMPITTLFACAQVGAKYHDFCTDYRVQSWESAGKSPPTVAYKS